MNKSNISSQIDARLDSLDSQEDISTRENAMLRRAKNAASEQ